MARLVIQDRFYLIPEQIVLNSSVIQAVKKDIKDEIVDIDYPFSLSQPELSINFLINQDNRSNDLDFVFETANLATFLDFNWEEITQKMLSHFRLDIVASEDLKLCSELIFFCIKYLLSFSDEKASIFMKSVYPNYTVEEIAKSIGVGAETEEEFFNKLTNRLVSKKTGERITLPVLELRRKQYCVTDEFYIDKRGTLRKINDNEIMSPLKFVDMIVNHNTLYNKSFIIKSENGDWWYFSGYSFDQISISNNFSPIFFYVKFNEAILIGSQENKIKKIYFDSNLNFVKNIDNITNFDEIVLCYVQGHDYNIFFKVEYQLMLLTKNLSRNDYEFIKEASSYYLNNFQVGNKVTLQVSDELIMTQNGETYRKATGQFVKKYRQIDNIFWWVC